MKQGGRVLIHLTIYLTMRGRLKEIEKDYRNLYGPLRARGTREPAIGHLRISDGGHCKYMAAA
jgi:hypothetical protein